ncbi:hypothetical protein B0J18DRAFT_407150 [Chaetomium sp. MPI-SDFR-AT-0129]|nr:hypothetical protein B0J18DRAFT_407150 [Chaetomium sp. MPI-SDFR-AT-0129]
MFASRARWQRSALLFAGGALAAFVANLSFTIWATIRPGSNIRGGVGVLSEETTCTRAKTINTAVHVMINVLSTVLLAGSNYCMQCLSAPTRRQIDEAHRVGRWVDVGVQSVRNLVFAVSGRNALLWVLLSLSSLPLHLFYNSAIFTSLSTNEYNITVVPSTFLSEPNRASLPTYLLTPHLTHLYDAIHTGVLHRLDLQLCVDTYSTNFQSSHGDLLIVTSAPTTANHHANENITSASSYPATYALDSLGCGIRQAYQWMCSQAGDAGTVCAAPCEDSVGKYQADPASWTPLGVQEVGACYALPTPERCKLLFSPMLCWIVTALNLVKAGLMVATAFWGGGRGRTVTGEKQKAEGGGEYGMVPGGGGPGLEEKRAGQDRLILTVGDAVASFMEHPDEATVDMCLTSKQDVIKSTGFWSKEPRKISSWRRSKFAAASPTRWMVCVLLYIVALIACIFLYGLGVNSIGGDKSFSSLMALGLAPVSSKTLMQVFDLRGGDDNLLSNVVIANSPQAILSMLYFTYNGLFTSISLATEWDSYATHRKGLRVSSKPIPHQRSTYFLQLPYRYSLPLLVTSGLLHWLISQSIFLVFVEIYRDSVESITSVTNTTRPVDNFTTCGWSPVGVITVIAIGFTMVIFLLGSGTRRLSSTMPVAGSCSAAIAAACHPPPLSMSSTSFEGGIVSAEKLMWGETSGGMDVGGKYPDEGDQASVRGGWDGNGMGESGMGSGMGIEMVGSMVGLVGGDGQGERERGHCSFSAGEVGVPRRGVWYS